MHTLVKFKIKRRETKVQVIIDNHADIAVQDLKESALLPCLGGGLNFLDLFV